tara:strand:+ start:1039 stop:1449 length:411 start_codon:yes stop_codon:yes gene_type:complete
MPDFTVYPDIDTLLQSTSYAAARSNLELGTYYATAAQGLLADSAQQPPIEGAFVNGDKTKLDSAQQPPVEGPFVNGDKTKLDNIAAGAEVNTINTTDIGEPATSNPVYNVVNISQTDYNAAIVAGTTVTTTFYIIT